MGRLVQVLNNTLEEVQNTLFQFSVNELKIESSHLLLKRENSQLQYLICISEIKTTPKCP